MYKWETKKVYNALIQLGDADDSGKGKHFKSRFFKDGLVKVEPFGTVFIKKENLDKYINTMVGVPVIINHKDLTDENVNDERVGVVNSVWYNEEDGWYWCDGIIWNETAQNLITDKGWSVSCSYDVKVANDEGGSENNIKYDIEFIDAVFTHLALVNNPRYERANIVFNGKMSSEGVNNMEIENEKNEKGKWVTIKGTHVFIPDGKTVDEVIKEKGWSDKKEGLADPNTKDFKNHLGRIEKLIKKYNLEPHEEEELLDELSSFEAKLDEGLEPREEEELREQLFDFEEDIKRHHEMKKEESKSGGYSLSDKYKNHIQFKEDKESGGYPRKIHKDLESAKEFYKYKKEGQTKAEEENLKRSGKRGIALRDNPVIVKNPLGEGYVVATAGLAHKHNLQEVYPINRANNSKEQEMEIIEKLKALIFSVENEKEYQMEVNNEKVDKRDIIRQIMAIAGKEEASEDVKTIAKLAEKLAYEKSEADSADNKKECKNEKEEDKKDEKVDNKCDVKNEDAKDEKEVKEVKEEVKEDVENKCKNSVDNSKPDYFNKLSEIYNSVSSKIESTPDYVSRADREKAADDYFRN